MFTPSESRLKLFFFLVRFHRSIFLIIYVRDENQYVFLSYRGLDRAVFKGKQRSLAAMTTILALFCYRNSEE